MATRLRHRDLSRPRRLFLFLVVLVALQFGYPITLRGEIWTTLYLASYAGMIVFGTRVLRDDRVERVPAWVLGLGVATAGAWFAFNQDDAAAERLMFTAVGLFQLWLLLALMRFIVSARSEAGRGELILAALSTYLLLGGVFGVAYTLLEASQPGSFVDTAAADGAVTWQTLLYFSYVTLSTLGYGEVQAVEPWARSLVTFESVTATLFLAVVIAQLVGAPNDVDRPGQDLLPDA